MRPSIKLLVALNCSLAAGSTACDEVTADDLAGLPDEPVSLRCDDPPLCLSGNSPYVGDYPFSNIRTFDETAAPAPSVASSDESQWESGQIQLTDGTWAPFDLLVPSPEGRLRVRRTDTGAEVYIDEALQAFFMLEIHSPAENPPTQLVPVWIRLHDVSPSPANATFNVWTYNIAAKTPPRSVDYPSAGAPTAIPSTTWGGINPWNGTYYSICPASQDETGKALVLKYVALNFDGTAAWLTDAYANDIANSSTSVLACQGHAFAKPQEFLAITPNSYVSVNQPGERSYGISGYNAAANAYRAYYDGAPRTSLGTPVHFKDFAHDPPWFDQTTSAHLPPSPIIGHYEFILESVYDDVDANGDVLGANCYYSESRFPAGVHRYYDPPGGNANLSGWSSMTSCGANQNAWDEFGLVGAFIAKHILPGGGNGDS